MNVLELIRGRAGGRRIAVVVALLGLAYVGWEWHVFSQGLYGYGDLTLGATPEEVTYYEGKPTSNQRGTTPGETIWIYQNNGQRLMSVFANGRVVELACGALGVGTNCPSVLGLGVGDTEDSLFKRFGPPTAEMISDGIKTMRFGELGYTFLLQRGRVQKIIVGEPQQNVAGLLNRFVRWAIP